jgi:hypothetical protein
MLLSTVRCYRALVPSSVTRRQSRTHYIAATILHSEGPSERVQACISVLVVRQLDS